MKMVLTVILVVTLIGCETILRRLCHPEPIFRDREVTGAVLVCLNKGIEGEWDWKKIWKY